MRPLVSILLIGVGSVLLAFAIGAASMKLPSSLDTRDVLVIAIALAGTVFFSLGVRETFRLQVAGSVD